MSDQACFSWEPGISRSLGLLEESRTRILHLLLYVFSKRHCMSAYYVLHSVNTHEDLFTGFRPPRLNDFNDVCELAIMRSECKRENIGSPVSLALIQACNSKVDPEN